MEGCATSADGIRVAYEVHGSGEPSLVLVHGWSCDRSFWREQFDDLAQRFRVVAIDLAGHGGSGVGRRSWTMPAFGNDVVAVVDELALREVVLVGHSMGGDVIVDAAVQLGDRVQGLVWVDTYDTLGEPRTPDEIEELLRPFREDFVTTTQSFVRRMFVPGSDPLLIELVTNHMSAAPPEIAVDALRYAMTNDRVVLDRLREPHAPLVAINPDHRPTDVEALRRHGVKTVLMSGVGHFAMLEDPDGFNRLLREVVEGFVDRG